MNIDKIEMDKIKMDHKKHEIIERCKSFNPKELKRHLQQYYPKAVSDRLKLCSSWIDSWCACMIVAIFNYNIEIIQDLIQFDKYQVFINKNLFNKKTPLIFAFEYYHIKYYGIYNDISHSIYNDISHSIYNDISHKIIDLLIQNGAKISIDKIFDLDITYEKKRKCLQIMIKHGKDINETDINGNSFLMNLLYYYHTYKSKLPIITLLEDLIEIYGANPNLSNNKGDTLLMIALKKDCHHDIIELLLIKYKVDVNVLSICKNFNALTILYKQCNILLSTDLHLLLCTEHNIFHIGIIYSNGMVMNTMQYLCQQMFDCIQYFTYYMPSRHRYLKRYITDILSNFKPIDVLYDVLTSQTIHIHLKPAIEFIIDSKIEEHKILAQQLVCKIKRKELLTFNNAIKQQMKPQITSKTQLFLKCSSKSRIDWSMHVASFLSENIESFLSE
jgi:ankyrin repeat protein